MLQNLHLSFFQISLSRRCTEVGLKRVDACLLLGDERTSLGRDSKSENDPNRTSATTKDIFTGPLSTSFGYRKWSANCRRLIGGADMRRRKFIGLIGGAAASPIVARAQQPVKMKRIAMVHASDPIATMVASYSRFYGAFFDEVSRFGFVEGKNLAVERYSAAGQPDRFAPLAREVVETHPDAIYAISSLLGLAFKAATTTIPVVCLTSDPVAAGLVSNIARPGANITGRGVNPHPASPHKPHEPMETDTRTTEDQG
jgi:ABC transporter substrate binding protein